MGRLYKRLFLIKPKEVHSVVKYDTADKTAAAIEEIRLTALYQDISADKRSNWRAEGQLGQNLSVLCIRRTSSYPKEEHERGFHRLKV